MRKVNQAASVATGVLAGLLLLTGCPGPKEDAPDVIVLQTGRLRGNVVPPPIPAPLQHYPVIAGYVKQVRAEAANSGAQVVLVDLGDSLEGSFAAHATGSANMVAFFNALDYDVIALSNLDNRVAPEVLAKLEAKVLNPFMGPDGAPATPGSSFSTLLDQGRHSILLMPNFYGDTNAAEHPDRFPSAYGPSGAPPRPLRDYAAVVAGAGALPEDTLSILTWMKFEKPDTPPRGFLDALREAGVDVIAAHRIYGGARKDVWEPGGFVNWQPPVSLNILRNNGGFSLARIDLKRDGQSWKVLRHELLPMTSNTASADEAIVREISAFAPEIAAADGPVTRLEKPVDANGILQAYLNTLTEFPGISAVLASQESIRSDWPAGELRASAVFNAMPWTTALVTLELTRTEIAALAKELGLTGLVRDDSGTGLIRVATSEFFARLIASKLGRQVSVSTRLAESEYDVFLAGLRRSPKLLADSPPGWLLIGGPTGDSNEAAP